MFTLPYQGISPREERVKGFRAALAAHALPVQSFSLLRRIRSGKRPAVRS